MDADLHVSVCQAVAILNTYPTGAIEVIQARDILRQALAVYADAPLAHRAAQPAGVEDARDAAQPWRIAQNRHPNTDGTRWGWIEGASGHVCWSDEKGSNLTRAQAGQMVKDHNDAIDASKGEAA